MYNFFLSILFIIFVFSPVFLLQASDFEHLAGRIVLQVEENGEAWYVSPDRLDRYFLGRPADAFALMREKGIGISDIDLEKIPVDLDLLSGLDTDGDGLPDEIEKSMGMNYLLNDSDSDGFGDFEELQKGYDPRSDQSLVFDPAFVARNLGKIFLQVESKGQAWYVFPENGKRYYLGRPMDAFLVMRNLGLGISNGDLDELIALSPSFNLIDFEKEIHKLINKERESFGLQTLTLNNELSKVAREHSQNLANENANFTALDSLCSFPLIHHEGLDFGLYQGDRLSNRGIKYYNMSGENIALLGSAAIVLTYEEGSVDVGEHEKCDEEQLKWDKDFKEAMEDETDEDIKITMLLNETKKRAETFDASPRLDIASAEWQSSNELAVRAVDGWMNSPGHRQNILKGEYDEAGMGVAYINSYVIITQLFIRRTDCGYEGASCCERENYQICYEPNTCVNSVCE